MDKALFETIKNIENDLRKKLLFLGYLSSISKQVPILVGGTAVEFYSGGFFQTQDIDVIFADNEYLNSLLAPIGFKRIGKDFISKELDIFIEAPSSFLAGDLERMSEIEISVQGYEFKVRIIGIEDLILDRMRSAVYWKDRRGKEQVKLLLELNNKDIDFPYLLFKMESEEGLKPLFGDIVTEYENENL